MRPSGVSNQRGSYGQRPSKVQSTAMPILMRGVRLAAPIGVLAGQQPEVRDDEWNAEVEADLDPGEAGGIAAEDHISLVDQREDEPDDESDPNGASQVLGTNAGLVGLPDAPGSPRLVGGHRRSGYVRGVSSDVWLERTTSAPSPTAAATRLVEPRRTSPTAKTPRLVHSSNSGARLSPSQCREKSGW